MKKTKSRIFIIILFLISVPILSLLFSGDYSTQSERMNNFSEKNNTPTTSTSNKDWTFMVYLDADCNLEAAGIDDVNEMEMEGSDSNINVIVQMDRISGGDSSNGDWTGAKRYYIRKDHNQGIISSSVVDELGEINMGDANNLENFIEWTKINYPADKYALILWDHGSGIMWGSNTGGVCFDESSYNDYLSLMEIESVLSDNPVDLIGFDACLMGNTEVHYQLEEYVDVIVGSEELEPGDGYPYNDIISYLKTNPTANADDLGQRIVNAYHNFYENQLYSYDITQAAAYDFELEFINSLTNFITDLKSIAVSQKSNIEDARSYSLEFGDHYIDLYDFADEIITYCSGEVDVSAQYLKNNISNIIIEEKHSYHNLDAHGLSIYFPFGYSSYSENYESCDFSMDFDWEEFLIKYYTETVVQSDDSFEENDDVTSSKQVSNGTYNSLILNGTDDDYFNISVYENDLITVDIIFNNSEGDLDLYLLNKYQDEVNSSLSVSDNEFVSYNATYTGEYTIKVISYSEDLYQPYDLIIDHQTDDSFEENDDWAHPSYILNNTLHTDLVCKDSDFYYFYASEDHLINVTIEFNYFEGDLDLYLWNFYAYEVSDSSTTATGSENILLTANQSGYYQIEVYNYQDNYDYSLQVSVEDFDDSYEDNEYISDSPILTSGSYENLVCIDDDLFNYSMESNTWYNITIDFQHDSGDLDLYLYNSSLDLVAFSISYTDNETIYYQSPIEQEVVINVYNYENNLNYDLEISSTDEIWDDKYEDNDYFDNPTELSIGTYKNLTGIDWDIYQFRGETEYEYTITLNHSVDDGDLDIYLYDSNETFINSSATYDNEEVIQLVPESDDDFLLLIYNYENTMEYDLKIERALPSDTTPPTWDPTPIDQSILEGENLSYDISATDNEAIDQYWVNDTDDFAIDSTGLLTNQTNLVAGDYILMVFVNDTNGNEINETIMITVVPDTTLPQWDPTPTDQTILVNESFIYDIDASDNVEIDSYWINDTIRFQIDTAGVITNATILSVGTYSLQIFVNDTSGNEISETIVITVQEDNSDNNVPDSDELQEIPGFNYLILLGISFLSIILSCRKYHKNVKF